MVLLGITAIKSLQHNNRHFMSACWTVLRRYQSYSKEQVTDIDCWMCILHKMLRPSWAEGSLWRWDTAGTGGFWCCIKRRRGMTEPLEKVLITNLKLIDSLNYQNKLIFQYFPVLSHYWRDIFFFNSGSWHQNIFKCAVCCRTHIPWDYGGWADKTDISHTSQSDKEARHTEAAKLLIAHW